MTDYIVDKSKLPDGLLIARPDCPTLGLPGRTLAENRDYMFAYISNDARRHGHPAGNSQPLPRRARRSVLWDGLTIKARRSATARRQVSGMYVGFPETALMPVVKSVKWKKKTAMSRTRLSALRMSLVVMTIACCGLSSPASAFDPQAGVTRESGPFDLFKFGFSAYKKGRKDEAVEAYRYAAEKGHTGSRWALANMYQTGDGVAEDDFEAFKIYNEIAQQGVEPGSEDTGYFVNALISLAGYYRRGISDSPVQVDLSAARQLYFQAASTFGVPEAQFQLARMILAGEGGNADVQQAKKWLNRARKKGHAGAMGVFGSVIFDEGQHVRGLAFMTAALDQCTPKDRLWLQDLQEQAFSLSSEDDRRVAISLAQEMHAKGVN